MLGVIEMLRPGSFEISHLTIEASEAMTLILIATGQTIVVLRGGIDLSLGATLSLATAIAATRTRDASFGELLPWIVVILVVGTLVGVINGALIAGLRLQPFVVTLATWSIIGGIALIILPVNQSSVPAAWFEAGNAKVLDLVPAPIALFLVLLAWWAWFRRTRWAFRIRAAGSDERGAFLNRVSLTRTNIVAYGLAGFFAALAGAVLLDPDRLRFAGRRNPVHPALDRRGRDRRDESGRRPRWRHRDGDRRLHPQPDRRRHLPGRPVVATGSRSRRA